MSELRIVTVTPGFLAHPGLAVATCRAGGVGILDLEWCRPGQKAQAQRNLLQICRQTQGLVGVRLRARDLGVYEELLSLLSDRTHWLLLSGWDERPSEIDRLPPSPGRSLWLELTTAESAAGGPSMPFAGWVLRGQDAGGLTGRTSAFVLAQEIRRTQRPFLVQGFVGLHCAAAYRTLGAAGVVLDDQLWLLDESPLPASFKALLRRFDEDPTAIVGRELGAPLRVVHRPEFPRRDELARRARLLSLSHREPEARAQEWRRVVDEEVGWGAPESALWPLGSSVLLARSTAKRYKTTGRFVQALARASEEHIRSAEALRPLGPGSPLARSHGTTYPIVQGPMTRVSDRAEFAARVAVAGALPLLALALMGRDEVATLLGETKRRLGERPWGVGILGFVPPQVREGQLAVFDEVRPPFALVAGARPEQVVALESLGTATYAHVASRGLLRLLLKAGVRRFVFEGRECGGHAGPLSSFALWELMVEALLEEVPAAWAKDVHVLVAGGLHDAASAAAASALAAPLAERGMAIGVLMGTAYLFTREAVDSGALVTGFQDVALECRDTAELVTGPGHVIRCAPTTFVQELAAQRHRLEAASTSPAEVQLSLEALTRGRARLASKGLRRDDGALTQIDGKGQRREGMYMMGELARLRNEVIGLEDLHRDVVAGGEVLARALPDSRRAEPPRPASAHGPSEIAIIGAGCLLPGAQSLDELWRNLLTQTGAVTEIPSRRWDWRLLYDPDPRAPDKIYSRWGGFLDELPFDPLRYGIPPHSLGSISVSQLLALEVTRRALDDAGYVAGDFDGERTAVIFGACNTADLGQLYVTRSSLDVCFESVSERGRQRLPPWTEESFPGTLTNVVAGRIANRFDLGGANYTVDAACASSLAALQLAVRELESGSSDVAIAGGVELEQTPHAFLAFSKTRALSPRGRSQPLDRRGDGIVISEGVAAVVLKRLADAQRDGDRVYAVVQAVAGSSDGLGAAITAPRPKGQLRALQRAWVKAGLGTPEQPDPSTLELYEAHATGTAVGDRAELETLMEGFSLHRNESRDGVRPGSSSGAASHASGTRCAVGSAKSLLGHTRAAAGMVGVLKAMLALHHQVLPPHAGVETPLEPLLDPASPLYLLDEARPWLDPGHRRRAGVSAFGFGGTNFHAVLEEHPHNGAGPELGARDWPHELWVLQATDVDGLRQALVGLRRLAEGSRVRPGDLAASYALEAAAAGPKRGPRAVLVSPGGPALVTAVDQALRRLEGNDSDSGPLPGLHLHLGQEPEAGEVAFLFPGQGAQRPGMARREALYVPELRRAAELADRLLADPHEEPLSHLLWPRAVFSRQESEAQHLRLAATDAAQPAVGVISCGLLDFARRIGLRAGCMAGHSFGEITALFAAGALSREDFLRLAKTRGRLMAAVGRGAMAAVGLCAEELESHLSALATPREKAQAEGSSTARPPVLVIANRNAPRQCVLSGDSRAVDEAVEQLRQVKVAARRLPVSAAFHSPLMDGATAPLAAALEALPLRSPAVPVCRFDGETYPQDPAEIRRLLVAQLTAPVDFVAQIETLYARGVHTFVELGPGRTLTGLVAGILDGRPHCAVSLGADDDADGGLRGLLDAVATLMGRGLDLDLEALFSTRNVDARDVGELLSESAPTAPGPQWRIDGGRVWRLGDEPRVGTVPLVTRETQGPPRMPEVTALSRTTTAMTPTSPAPRPGDPETTVQVPGLTLAADPAAEAGTRPGLAQALGAYESYQATMRQFLELQERMMSQLLDRVQEAEATVPPDNGDTANKTASRDDSAPSREPERELLTLPDRKALAHTVVALAARQTGYPASLLGLDRDMEAELGIDSIKRIELIASLEEQLPAAVAWKVQAKVDVLARSRSLAELVDGVLEELVSGDGEAVPAPVPAVSPPATVVRETRYRMEGEAKAGFTVPEEGLGGLYLVTEDELGVAASVQGLLRQRGALAFLVSRDALAQRQALERRITVLMAAHGAVRGVVHLAPLARTGEVTCLADWRRETRLGAKSLFQILQLLVPELDGAHGEPLRVLAASLLGGDWGRRGTAEGSAAGGASHGLLRCVGAEYPRLQARVVDFDAPLGAARIAQGVLEELLAPGGDREVGYSAAGERTVFVTQPAPRPTGAARASWEPQPGWVVLATGGARGLTAQLCRRIAVAGVRLIVVGRSDPPVDESAPDPMADVGVDELRRHFLDQLHAGSAGNPSRQGDPPSPVEVEAKVTEFLAARQRRCNLAALRERGAEVEYHAADVRSEAQFGALLDDVYRRYGRIDAVLHGAGVIEDRRLADKSYDSFERVFDTKADSAFLLTRHLKPRGLRWVVLMGSVAGRFGNRGQGDYAAGNEVLNRLAWQMKRLWPATRVLCLNWGPWRHTGMTSDAIAGLLERRGILPLAPEEGVQFFLDELASPHPDDVEIIAGDGPWRADDDRGLRSFSEVQGLFTQLTHLA